MEIQLKNIVKKYDDFIAVNNVSLHVKSGNLLALIGSSGCGKTTLLRIVAGLIEPNGGEVYLGGNNITSWSPQKRSTAMVFQNYALFPHMTVFDNVAYGLKVRKVSAKEIRYKVDSVLEKVHLTGLGSRRIQELSGGQKQRAALARALVIEPDVLLFDEPLSNLDESLRVSMRKEIRRIQKDINITSIYVTHDQEEAISIADEIAIMNEGQICQIGKPDDVYYMPNSRISADFLGHPNLFVEEVKQDLSGRFINVLGKRFDVETIKNHILIMIRPEEVHLSENGISGKVIESEILGPIRRYKISVEGKSLFMDVMNRFGEIVHLDNTVITFNLTDKSVYVIDN